MERIGRKRYEKTDRKKDGKKDGKGSSLFMPQHPERFWRIKIDQEGRIVLPEKSDSKKESSTKGSTKNCAKGLTGLQEDATRKDRPNERQNERQNERKASNPLPLEIKGNLYSIEKNSESALSGILERWNAIGFSPELAGLSSLYFPG